MAEVNDEYAGQFNYGQADGTGEGWVQAIAVRAPAYRSTVSGTITVTFAAPGMTRAEARCWHQPDEAHPGPWGYDAVVMPPRDISGDGETSFEFPLDEFPHGPTTLRISTTGDGGTRDVCELQLFNSGGVPFKQGCGDAPPPPGAAGMQLIFCDDFDSPLGISADGVGARYACHKPPRGDFSGYRFTHADDFDGALDPFERMDTWLRIKARSRGTGKRDSATGIISSADFDGHGFYAAPPCYLECRFVAQSAPGTWPAFWTLTVPVEGGGADELDIIEGYGGVGPGNPNSSEYHLVTHHWGQTDADGKPLKGAHRRVPVMELGGKSFWSTTPHTYAVMIGTEETVYYYDDIEVLRHASGPLSKRLPVYFLVNLAIGGISGWPIDLARYGGGTDMWVDFVRVYSECAPPPRVTPPESFIFDAPVTVNLTSTVPGARILYTLDGSDPGNGAAVFASPLEIAEPCTIKAVACTQALRAGKADVARVRRACEPATPSSTSPGLTCACYQGEFRSIPELGDLSPAFTEVTPGIVAAKQEFGEQYLVCYTGYVEVPEGGVYTFHTHCDDAVQLFVGGEVVVDKNGVDAPRTRSGPIGLRAGLHAFEARGCRVSGGEGLSVSWQGPGVEAGPLPASALCH